MPLSISQYVSLKSLFLSTLSTFTLTTDPQILERSQRIKNYHKAQTPSATIVDTQDGILCRREPRAIPRVGFYVPGGSAPLVSSVMMQAIPALIAGCPLRILATPPKPDGTIDSYLLRTAEACGVQRIYKIGGAQAIAAMAYGTETVPKVDKIYGPGNAWVTEAKKIVAQDSKGGGYRYAGRPF